MSVALYKKYRAQFRLLYLVCGHPGLRDLREVFGYISLDRRIIKSALDELTAAGVFQVTGTSIHPTRKGHKLAEALGLSLGKTARISSANTIDTTTNPNEYIPEDFRRGGDEWSGS